MGMQTVHEVMAESLAGKLTFPEVVRRLLELGVESYFVDFAARSETVYMEDQVLEIEELAVGVDPVNATFSEEKIVEAIRGAQADRVRYPEFVRLATAAGVVGYWAFLTGQKVVYFGRKGEMHTEVFPGAKS